MRSERISFIPGQSKHFSLLQRKPLRSESQVHRKGLVLVLISLHHLFHLGHELMKMPVYRSQSIVVGNVHRLTISTGSHRHPADVTVGNATDRLSHHPLCLEVHSSMKMIGSQFPEVPAQEQGKVEGRNKRIFRFFLSRKCHRTPHDGGKNQASYLVFQIPFSFHRHKLTKKSTNSLLFRLLLLTLGVVKPLK